jgi:YD repeat-containing protein
MAIVELNDDGKIASFTQNGREYSYIYDAFGNLAFILETDLRRVENVTKTRGMVVSVRMVQDRMAC